MLNQPSKVSVNAREEISQERWIVAMVRRRGAEHAFLLIEGIDNDGIWRLFRADLFIDGDKPLFTASRMALSGTALIRLVEADLNHLVELENKGGWYEQSWPVTQHQALDIMQKIEKSSTEDIKYALPGDGSIYRGSRGSGKVHNCATWCSEQLRSIGLEVHGSWTDQFVVRPSDLVPGDSAEEKPSMCMMM